MSDLTNEIDELVTEITLELWNKFKNFQPRHKKKDQMITYIIRELAIEKIENKKLKCLIKEQIKN